MLTFLSIVLAMNLGVAKPVEHWRAEAGGYAVTFYPGFASRAYIQEPSGQTIELYRQSAPYNVADGSVSTKHQIRLNGAALDDSVAVSIDDPKHEVAAIRIALHSGRILFVDNRAVTCPPTCLEGESKAALPSRMLVDAGRFDAPLTKASARGYDIAFYGGFASRITSSAGGELFRQSKPFVLGDAAKAGRHEIHIAGGPSQRDVTLGIADGEHQIARISLELYGQDKNETIDIDNSAPTCPPVCK